MYDLKKKKTIVLPTPLTHWTMDIPVWISGVLVVFLVMSVVVGEFGFVANTVAFLCGTTLFAFGIGLKIRRFNRESIARKAVELLASTREGADIDALVIMRKALADNDFLSGFRLAIQSSIWRVRNDDERVAQWVITFPETWSDPRWSWCAFGIICAGRPLIMHCSKSQRSDNILILDVSVPADMINVIRSWERTLGLSFALAGYSSKVSSEYVEDAESGRVHLVIEQVTQPWAAKVLLQPEGVELSFEYDGAVWFATTRKNEDARTVSYRTWSEMWSIWRHFPEAGAILTFNNRIRH
jgi:hypothetical protein